MKKQTALDRHLEKFDMPQDNLLEDYEQLPQPVQEVLLSFDQDADPYHECKRVISDLEKHGYTADFDLSGTLFDLQKVSKPNQQPEAKQFCEQCSHWVGKEDPCPNEGRYCPHS